MKLTLLCCALGLAFVAAPVQSEEKKEEKKDTAPVSEPKEVAVFKTSEGEMVAEFWPDVAPNTVENFKKLAKSGFYDGTAFHRILKGFMAQGGDPLTKNPSKEAAWGTGDPGYKIKAEFNKKLHVRGVLSMARSTDPDSAGSQFFICFAPASQLDGKYTAFGKIIKGDDVLDKLANVPVTRNSAGENSKPVNRVALESVKIVPADSVK
jgi:peptidyl-prolyl cis-trans isomerase B (cyclophilin B)